ncbi:Phosphorylase domain-containing protein/Glyco_hydro_3 domain-containing protein/Glyco_hydro_3_C domain-containing protein [Cephalotus follicularis]|uniref:Alpha-1,4 glucan phosphorylase n=1 Tax=Cephalotus follicularis TaxID=3775 RepID=A0A1Q3C362_CEPFO|nr:Phosphorylase domain-containing protein/Glyco_hydro_3 domain-containing protein/Glyco_hydro_3_C domain-containing protein [Cephalotus follicularis]
MSLTVEGKIDCTYKDPNALIEARVQDLLSRMTLREKVGQMTQIERRVATPSVLRDLSIGSILSSGGSGPFENALASDWADMVDGFQKAALESRLGIPLIYGIDAVHGNNSIYGATIFPHNVALGATRDADLAQRIGVATALEVRASGIHYAFAPCVAICKDPRWGRCYESYSEDTEIVRKMTTIVTGLQGKPPKEHPKGYPFVAGRNNVIACAKHFVGDGGTDKGVNEGNTISSYDDLEKIHMAPYLDCISQGVSTVMASYSSWNGRKLHADHFLLTEVLKEKLGFKGFVISDWEGLDRLSQPHGSNYRYCISTAVNAGIDMVMVPLRYELFVEDLIYLVESGEVPISRIDDAVERILRVKFVSGLFEHPFSDRSLLDLVGCKLHRELAREAVRKSLVLLKNGKDPKKPFLPLDRNAKKILVTGSHADNLGYQCGGWTITWYGLSGRITIGTTILDAIKAAVGDKTEVVYEQYPTPETLARQEFSFAIIAVGEEPYAETPGDNSVLNVPLNGNDVISTVADKVPTLAILISGRPLRLEPWLLEKVDAFIAAWLPGSEAEGITDIVFGDYEFEGLLPITWFKTVDQLPMDAKSNSYDPLFPLETTTNTNGATVSAVSSKIPATAHPLANKPTEIASNINYHVQFSPHFSPFRFEPEQAYYATAESVRDRLIQQWNETYLHHHKVDPKQTYYLSMEYLQGRALTNAIGNLDVENAYAEALNKLGHELEDIVEQEKDAALGNGGLGRLASCFLDSMATLNLPAWGYGLRYRYGLFKQVITKEGQEEIAEDWLEKFSPWEVVRHDVVFPVRFFGYVKIDPDGSRKWVGGEVMQALAYDVPIPGYKTKNTISLRLWEAKACADDFNLFQFNDGQYESAAQLHSQAQQICAVLYPGDATENGKILRLKQQFFLCSASLQDIILRFKERKSGKGSWKWSEFPSKVAVQLNDTHPTLAIPELLRLLMDEEGLGWDEAWDVTTRTIAYTNHTVLPEALEKWSQDVLRKLLPRHMEIIEEIDRRFIALIHTTRTDLQSKLPSMCIMDNNPQKPVVRMANLCVVSSHTVNGVAQLHSDILKSELFADYVSLWPKKFQNKTNGITPRRWLRFCSPELSSIITKWLKTDEWVTSLELLTGLRQFADSADFQSEWASAKMANKQRLAQYILQVTGVSIDPNSLFDIQVKRIHEYKRQLLNILGAISRYKKLKEMSPEERKNTTSRTVMIGGKAFATYTNAKRIVKLVNDVGTVVNNDPEVNKYLKVVFVPNYNVSVAEILIPGSELSQHISTAGMEASGTSNMKFALNGCLIIGTLDGANVEIREEIGEANFFLCGATADEVPRLRKFRENGMFVPDPRFEEAKQFIRSGAFGGYNYDPLLDSLEGNTGYGRGDYFLVGHDFASYMDAQARVDEAYKDRKRWLRMSILSTAGSGKFSSDRTISQYAREIWNIEECRVP